MSTHRARELEELRKFFHEWARTYPDDTQTRKNLFAARDAFARERALLTGETAAASEARMDALICDNCGADRLKTGCALRNIGDCKFIGKPQSAAPPADRTVHDQQWHEDACTDFGNQQREPHRSAAPDGERPGRYTEHFGQAWNTPTPRDASSASSVTQTLVRQLIERDAKGRAKYGKTLDREDLTRDEWLQHLIEELLDAAGYAEAAKRSEPVRVVDEKRQKQE